MRICFLLLSGFLSTAVFSQSEQSASIDPSLRLAFDVATMNESQLRLTPSQTALADEVSRYLAKGENELAVTYWQNLVAENYLADRSIDLEALILFVLRDSYLESIDDLRYYASKVRYHNAQKKEIRESIYRAELFRSILEDRFLPTDEIDFQLVNFVELDEQNSESGEHAELDLRKSIEANEPRIQILLDSQRVLREVAKKIIGRYES